MAAASEPTVHVMLTPLYLTARRTVDRDRDVSLIIQFETRPSGDADNDDFARSDTTGDKRESRAQDEDVHPAAAAMLYIQAQCECFLRRAC